MAWYDVPKVRVKYVYDDKGNKVGVMLSPADFEKLAEKMEDLLDHQAIERAKKGPVKFYSHEEIGKIIERKKR